MALRNVLLQQEVADDTVHPSAHGSAAAFVEWAEWMMSPWTQQANSIFVDMLTDARKIDSPKPK